MGILAEKKAGKATGKFRVELQRTVDGQKERYRQRHDTYAAAKADEDRVKAMWAAGVAQDVVNTRQSTGGPLTLAEAMLTIRKEGSVWRGQASEECTWQRMEHISRVIGTEPVETIDARVINRLIRALEEAGKAPGTINRYISHLRRFLVECRTLKLRKSEFDENMFAWQQEPDGRIRWVTPDEEKAIYAYLEARQAPEAHAVRDLIEVALETGCRRDELLTVELGQINGTRLHLWKTKTKTPRTIPMTDRTTALLHNLVASGTMPTRRGLRSWWNRVRDHLGLQDDRDFVFHACRHTRATRMVEAGINVFVIKEWMGHKVIETTLRYAHVKPENLEQALVKVGNYMAGGLQEARNSAASDVPHTVPHVGGYGLKRA